MGRLRRRPSEATVVNITIRVLLMSLRSFRTSFDHTPARLPSSPSCLLLCARNGPAARLRCSYPQPARTRAGCQRRAATLRAAGILHRRQRDEPAVAGALTAPRNGAPRPGYVVLPGLVPRVRECVALNAINASLGRGLRPRTFPGSAPPRSVRSCRRRRSSSTCSRETPVSAAAASPGHGGDGPSVRPPAVIAPAPHGHGHRRPPHPPHRRACTSPATACPRGSVLSFTMPLRASCLATSRPPDAGNLVASPFRQPPRPRGLLPRARTEVAPRGNAGHRPGQPEPVLAGAGDVVLVPLPARSTPRGPTLRPIARYAARFRPKRKGPHDRWKWWSVLGPTPGASAPRLSACLDRDLHRPIVPLRHLQLLAMRAVVVVSPQPFTVCSAPCRGRSRRRGTRRGR